MTTYNEICSCQQGRITLTKLVLDEIFLMSCNVINAHKNYLKISESKSLTYIHGKNFSVVTKELGAALVSLNKVGTLSDENYGDVFCGFTKCKSSLSATSNSVEI